MPFKLNFHFILISVIVIGPCQIMQSEGDSNSIEIPMLENMKLKKESAESTNSTEIQKLENMKLKKESAESTNSSDFQKFALRGSCKALWDNSCVRNKDCCSKFCDKPPHWASGVCKQSSETLGDNEVCKPLWDNSCIENQNCCSENCEKNLSWAFGVCKPNKGHPGVSVGAGSPTVSMIPEGSGRSGSEIEVYAKTIYAEARGEPETGQIWVAWVIKNRARMDREYWGGNTIKGVCLKPGQFECWNGVSDIPVHEPEIYQRIEDLANSVYTADHSNDPTGASDHYNNPDKEGYPAWTNNCVRTQKIGNHQFYKGP